MEQGTLNRKFEYQSNEIHRLEISHLKANERDWKNEFETRQCIKRNMADFILTMKDVQKRETDRCKINNNYLANYRSGKRIRSSKATKKCTESILTKRRRKMNFSTPDMC